MNLLRKGPARTAATLATVAVTLCAAGAVLAFLTFARPGHRSDAPLVVVFCAAAVMLTAAVGALCLRPLEERR